MFPADDEMKKMRAAGAAPKTPEEIRAKIAELCGIDARRVPVCGMDPRTLIGCKVGAVKSLLWALGVNDDDRYHIPAAAADPIDMKARVLWKSPRLTWILMPTPDNAVKKWCRICHAPEHPGVSCYWAGQAKTAADKRPRGRTFERSDGRLGCDECCSGDRCDDPTHRSRESCPYCLGSGTPADPVLTTQ